MRIIIAGSRDFSDFNLLQSEALRIIKELKLDGFKTTKNVVEIVSGGARGADLLGEKFANTYGLKIKRFIPDWDGLGKRAGYVRNAEMATYAKQDSQLGVLIACWDGKSRGTKSMIDLAEKHGLRVFIIRY
ncbi:MAG TPA: SLOG family protein [Clostridium sp.]|uniref:SLOG family protein n=1 Tax=Clostridium sp. TaxID=1506 RepID=UPI002F95A93B